MGRSVIAVPLLCLLVIVVAPIAEAASAQDDWKAEFDAVCAKTDDPMVLDRAELESLVERCDKLKPRIEALDPTTAKVYLRRLQMCRNLFEFVLKSKPR